MARKESAGALLYCRIEDTLHVLLVHPSGAYNRKASWSIPKGSIEPDEPAEAAARRETLEETGVVAGELLPLGFVDYRRSRKRIHGFAGPAPQGAAPRCASWEIDCAELVTIERARQLLHPDQEPFLDRLLDRLSTSSEPSP